MLRNSSTSSHEKSECTDGENDKHDVYRYTRDEMLNMKDVFLSKIRPQYLSTEFDK